MSPIQFVDLKKQYAPYKEEILSGIEHILDGMQLFLGENVRALESEFSKYCGVKHGIGVSDGTAALQIILRAMDIGPGDEVITVAHTFIATIEAILLTGAKPVFVDINPDTFLMDVDQVEARITSKTKAIIAVQLYGQMVDMAPLLEIARRYHLKVIEDAAQAHGSSYHGHKAGSVGDATGFSFYYSKNLGAYGEAGFITTSDDEIARRCRMIRDHGSEERYHHDLIGFNGRLDEIQALVCRVKLPHLEEWNEARIQHAEKYRQALSGSPVVVPSVAAGNRPVYHLYVIKTPRRDELQAYLKSLGIFTGIHYPIPNHLQKAVQFLGYKSGDLPVTEKIVGEILSLPMYAELEDAEIEYAATAVCNFFRS